MKAILFFAIAFSIQAQSLTELNARRIQRADSLFKTLPDERFFSTALYEPLMNSTRIPESLEELTKHKLNPFPYNPKGGYPDCSKYYVLSDIIFITKTHEDDARKCWLLFLVKYKKIGAKK